MDLFILVETCLLICHCRQVYQVQNIYTQFTQIETLCFNEILILIKPCNYWLIFKFRLPIAIGPFITSITTSINIHKCKLWNGRTNEHYTCRVLELISKMYKLRSWNKIISKFVAKPIKYKILFKDKLTF